MELEKIIDIGVIKGRGMMKMTSDNEGTCKETERKRIWGKIFFSKDLPIYR